MHASNQPSSKEAPRSAQSERVVTASGSLQSFIAIDALHCAACGTPIVTGERFTRPWRGETRQRQAVCRACLPIHVANDHEATRNDERHTGQGLPEQAVDVVISYAQWAAIAPVVPVTVSRAGALSDRVAFAAVLYRFRNQCTWSQLPDAYAPWQACRWRYQRWIAVRALPAVLDAFLRTLDAEERRVWAPLLKREEVSLTADH